MQTTTRDHVRQIGDGSGVAGAGTAHRAVRSRGVRAWTARLGFAVAGLAFIAYPAIRPAGPEQGLAGATAWAGSAWVLAHSLGMLGFMALAFAVRAASHAGWVWSGQPLRRVESRLWLGTVLVLPYYGAETFGLHAAGSYAVASGLPQAAEAVAAFRYAPVPMAMFGAGLFVLMLAGARIIIGLWRSGLPLRSAGLLAGLGLIGYLPQFFLPMPLRIVHGVVLGLGLLLLAVRGGRLAPEA